MRIIAAIIVAGILGILIILKSSTQPQTKIINRPHEGTNQASCAELLEAYTEGQSDGLRVGMAASNREYTNAADAIRDLNRKRVDYHYRIMMERKP